MSVRESSEPLGGYATRIELYSVLGALLLGILIGVAGC